MRHPDYMRQLSKQFVYNDDSSNCFATESKMNDGDRWKTYTPIIYCPTEMRIDAKCQLDTTCKSIGRCQPKGPSLQREAQVRSRRFARPIQNPRVTANSTFSDSKTSQVIIKLGIATIGRSYTFRRTGYGG